MGPDPRGVAQRFTSELRQLFHSRLKVVWLFGSVARGEERPDSDVDLLVVLDRHDAATLRSVYSLADRLSRAESVDLSVKVLSEAEYAAERSGAFLRNVEAEGVALA